MSDPQLKTVEPDPAATSVSNDQAVNKPDSDPVKPDAKVETAATPQAESTDTAPADDNIAKDTKVETGGNVTNGDKKDEGEVKIVDNDADPDKSQDSKKRKFPSKYADDDPKNKYRTSGLKNRGNLFDPSVQEKTDDPVAIRKQVEFYFSDHNLARDRFLYNQVDGPKNKPVQIEVIHNFKRMRRYQPFEAVVNALKDSKVLEVVEEISVRRKQPLPAEFADKTPEEITRYVEEQSMARSIYIKGFGKEEPTTQFDLEAWFSQFGDTNAVRLRRADDKSFKGSVFVEFADEATAKKFLDTDPKPTYNDRELLIMSKLKYCDEKLQAIRDGKVKPRGDKVVDRHVRSRSDNRDWRERRDEDSKNGFRGGRGRGRGGRDRGGRGRGRGGRGGYGGDRHDRNDEKKAKAEAEAADNKVEAADSAKAKDEPKESAKSTPKKRAREEDDGEHRDAKKEKLDTAT